MQSLSDEKSCLLTILTCLICQERATQAHICPNCSKFFCFICIQTWICEKSNQCPYCTETLEENQLVNCQKLCADLSQALDSMGQPKKKTIQKCSEHSLDLNYFCETCQTEVCSDCCALTIQHQGHTFLKTSTIKRQFEKETNRLKLLINNSKYNIENLLTQEKDFSASFERKVEKDTRKFAQFVKNLKERTDKNCHSEILALEKMIANEKNISKESHQIYDENLQLIKECPKIEFVLTKSDEVKLKLKSHIEKLKTSNIKLKEKIEELDSHQIESKILPPFATKTFSLKNFWDLYHKNEMIYTEILSGNGLEWRLKIYPAGITDDSEPINENSKISKNIHETYLSVFVELKSSIREKGKYRHKVVIESEKTCNKKIERYFESEFERGECWGYDKFAKISHLNDNGFISSINDELKITLLIGPANYFEASEDLKFYLEKQKKMLVMTPEGDN